MPCPTLMWRSLTGYSYRNSLEEELEGPWLSSLCFDSSTNLPAGTVPQVQIYSRGLNSEGHKVVASTEVAGRTILSFAALLGLQLHWPPWQQGGGLQPCPWLPSSSYQEASSCCLIWGCLQYRATAAAVTLGESQASWWQEVGVII